MHCHKIERVTQVIDNKAVAVLAVLPYRLSPTLILHLKAFLANQHNSEFKLMDCQRTSLASKESLNTNIVVKGALAINLGTSIHHPGDNMFYRTDSPDLLPRQCWEPISVFEPFGW
jgi:hypothetical protein